ncbi:MAG: type I restriction endonuclease, partial [Gammaproteobacteria bacterium]
MKTDTSERGLERLICTALTGSPCDPDTGPAESVRERPAIYGAGWIGGAPEHYDREYCVDLAQLSAFLRETQPQAADALDLRQDGPTRRKFLARLQGEITKRGTIDVLRHGIRHGPHHLDLLYGRPSPGNAKAQGRYAANRFSVTGQLRYSRDETQLALDLGLFINGLPVATFELKNSLTKQTVEDAVQQYKRDRDPREKLFEFGRCVVHFAVDDHEVRFCTHLNGKASWFLPFNLGWNDGAGNPPNPNGLKTDYLWKRILTRDGLTDILENYAQVVEAKEEKTGRKKSVQIWPRFHQLDVVRKLLVDAGRHGAGKRYLIQHSAGSGKSNSIAWLAHQLIGLTRRATTRVAPTIGLHGTEHPVIGLRATTRVAPTSAPSDAAPSSVGAPLVGAHPDDAAVFDSIIVVTDRRILDQQIKDTIKQFAQVGATVGHAEHSGDLRKFIAEGKKIIISTVQKFPFILDEIGSEHRGRRFAVVIDEAHSSQGGRTSAAVSMALGTAGAEEDDETTEDRINRLMGAKKLLP